MAHVLTAVSGSSTDIVPITRALISVSDKTNIIPFCEFLSSQNVHLLSTGGTAQKIRSAGLPVTDVSTHTSSPECLDGRVKTLHPKIHGGLLGVRGNAEHESQMEKLGIDKIDMTILNLYPFEQTVKGGGDFAKCVENIDIGGPSMLRSTAKNHASTTIVTSPDQYDEVMECMKEKGGTTLSLRRKYAARAFALSASYDSTIAQWFSSQLTAEDSATAGQKSQPVVTRVYQHQFPLKYGCNPHQKPASISSLLNSSPQLPFRILNGIPGYINLLDATNAWQLVLELHSATSLASAASFKHVSPAGAAVAVPLNEAECAAYEIEPEKAAELTPVALAYLRARNADPMCSFGDFCAVSDVVDEKTAMILKREVSDGIIAKGYTEEALEILKKKKGGKYLILEATENYDPGEMEYREVYGMAFAQKRNDVRITKEDMTKKIATSNKDAVTPDVVRDMIVASICIKYTQSNSVGFAKDGMMVGVGAGQQSRVDCVKLAGRKVKTWYLRQHPKVLALKFNAGVKRQDRVNARVRYIEGDFTKEERQRWEAQFEVKPEDLTEAEKEEFMASSSGVTISSDAFFPFRDSIDHASKCGVTYVAQPGGSVQDGQVTAACEEYGMAMCFTGVRLFHH